MEGERNQAREYDQPGYRGVEHSVINKREEPGSRSAENIHLLAAEPVRQVAGKRNREQRHERRDQQHDQQEVARGADDLHAIGENESVVDKDGSHLSHPR